MGFELTIAAKREPASEPDDVNQASSCVNILANGELSTDGIASIVRAVIEQSSKHAETIVVVMEDVRIPNEDDVASFARALMELRTNGVNVQVGVRDERLHAALASAPKARDWLIAFAAPPSAGPRYGVHVDQPPKSDR